MNYFNDYALDELASRVVGAYLRVDDVPHERVDPVALCERILGLKVLHFHLSPDDSILGMTSYGTAKANVMDEDGDWAILPLDGKKVLIEKDLLENPCGAGQYNFTVAHEAAHHIFRAIHQDGGNDKNRLLVHRNAKTCSVEFDEWQTDRLAAALLMNGPMLRSAMAEAGIPGGIKVLENRVGNSSWYGFCRTAEILGVSLSALEVRMNSMRLIEKDYYHNMNSKTSILDVC